MIMLGRKKTQHNHVIFTNIFFSVGRQTGNCVKVASEMELRDRRILYFKLGSSAPNFTFRLTPCRSPLEPTLDNLIRFSISVYIIDRIMDRGRDSELLSRVVNQSLLSAQFGPAPLSRAR